MGNSPGDETYSPVIRFYDEAGNVIENARARGRVQRAREEGLPECSLLADISSMERERLLMQSNSS